MDWEIKNKLNVVVRPVRSHEIKRLAQIEKACFEDDYWTAKEIKDFARDEDTAVLVAVVGAKVVGHMLVDLLHRSVCIVAVVVDPMYRRSGVGRQLVDEAMDMINRRRPKIVLHVRETNLDAQLFFRQMGFRATKMFRGFWFNDDEAAIRMKFRKIIPRRDDQNDDASGLVIETEGNSTRKAEDAKND